MGVKLGDTVTVNYRGTLADGTCFDETKEGQPFSFRLGSGQVIAGFEDGVLGRDVGESFRIEIPFDQAYGDFREDLVLDLEKSLLPEDIDLEVGLMLNLPSENGMMVPAKVTEVSGTTITVDANHPLAGQDLVFELTVISYER